MVIVSNEWIENVEEKKSTLGTNGMIMAAPGNFTVNSPDNAVRSDWKQPTQCNINSTNNRGECARAVLLCEANSHPFQTRTLILEPGQEIKVGRSIARNRVSENNAIFDCKVLSRNHAVIWYSDGKFYVKDTRSSNGTFINERRISQSESEELNSGDIVKFGVDVIENSRKEVHGCIIACAKLYTPDGRELISNSSNRMIPGEGSISIEELHRLHHYMQEAVQREKSLEIKLQDIQKIIELTRRNSTTCWQAMIDEDRLINRIDILENKLQFFQKNAPENRLRDEIIKLQEDRSLYQNSAKEALRKVYQERMDAMQKLTTIERALCCSEDECSLLRDQLLHTQQSLQEVNCRLTHFEDECKEHRENSEKAKSEVEKHDSEAQRLSAKLIEKEQECQDYKDQICNISMKMNTLQTRLDSFEVQSDDTDELISKNSNDTTKGTVLKWFENSDLKNKEDSVNIINAICNDMETNEEDDDDHFEDDLIKIYEKLLTVGNDLERIKSESTNLSTEEEEDEISSSTSLNDGNQNINLTSYHQILTTSASTLTDVHQEIVKILDNLKKEKQNLQTNDLESKLKSLQEDMLNLQTELNKRPTFEQYQQKQDENKNLQDEINTLKSNEIEMRQQIDKLESNNKSLENEIEINKSLDDKRNVNDDDDKYGTLVANIDNNKSIENNINKVIDEDLEIINNSKVQHEEELIVFKEKYDHLLHENLELKNELNILKTDMDSNQKKAMTRIFIYGAVLIAFIGYLLSKFLKFYF